MIEQHTQTQMYWKKNRMLHFSHVIFIHIYIYIYIYIYILLYNTNNNNANIGYPAHIPWDFYIHQ